MFDNADMVCSILTVWMSLMCFAVLSTVRPTSTTLCLPILTEIMLAYLDLPSNQALHILVNSLAFMSHMPQLIYA